MDEEFVVEDREVLEPISRPDKDGGALSNRGFSGSKSGEKSSIPSNHKGPSLVQAGRDQPVISNTSSRLQLPESNSSRKRRLKKERELLAQGSS